MVDAEEALDSVRRGRGHDGQAGVSGQRDDRIPPLPAPAVLGTGHGMVPIPSPDARGTGCHHNRAEALKRCHGHRRDVLSGVGPVWTGAPPRQDTAADLQPRPPDDRGGFVRRAEGTRGVRRPDRGPRSPGRRMHGGGSVEIPPIQVELSGHLRQQPGVAPRLGQQRGVSWRPAAGEVPCPDAHRARLAAAPDDDSGRRAVPEPLQHQRDHDRREPEDPSTHAVPFVEVSPPCPRGAGPTPRRVTRRPATPPAGAPSAPRPAGRRTGCRSSDAARRRRRHG